MKSIFIAFLAITAAPVASFAPLASTRSPPTTSSALHATSRRTVLATSVVSGLSLLTRNPSATQALETYLTEPTEEFKESERQRMEFRKKQLAVKGEFVKVLARLTTESNTEEELVNDLTQLRNLVTQTGGLPLGIKKEDMYKVIRSKKAKGNWPTNVEIA
jgi:hypothetical protein